MTNEDVGWPVELGRESRLFLARVEGAHDAAKATDWLATRHPGGRFVAVVSFDLHDHLGPVLTALHTAVAEYVFFDALTPPHRTGNETAMHALEALGLGQDFVFTVA